MQTRNRNNEKFPFKNFLEYDQTYRVATGQWKKIQPKIANFGIVFQPFSANFSKKADGFPAFPASIRTGKQTLVLGMQEEPKNGG